VIEDPRTKTELLSQLQAAEDRIASVRNLQRYEGLPPFADGQQVVLAKDLDAALRAGQETTHEP